jgi:hypothetical protein
VVGTAGRWHRTGETLREAAARELADFERNRDGYACDWRTSAMAPAGDREAGSADQVGVVTPSPSPGVGAGQQPIPGGTAGRHRDTHRRRPRTTTAVPGPPRAAHAGGWRSDVQGYIAIRQAASLAGVNQLAINYGTFHETRLNCCNQRGPTKNRSREA